MCSGSDAVRSRGVFEKEFVAENFSLRKDDEIIVLFDFDMTTFDEVYVAANVSLKVK